MTAGGPVLEVDDLGLTYGDDDVRALDGVSCTLDGGRIYGLLGRNGSGKTSLLSVLAGFRRASQGTVRLDGRPVFEDAVATEQICLIRGSGDTIECDWPDDRVSDALAFAAKLRPAWDRERAAELVDRFEVPLRRRVGKLSRGQRAALGVVLGLAARAPVTMLDESYLGMDVPSRYALNDAVLEDFMTHPRTIILATHLVGEVEALFEQVMILDRGRLLVHEDADDLRSRGAEVTGPAAEVDRVVEGRTVLGERRLGPTRSVVVYGDPLEPDDRARRAGVEVGPATLQDLFMHLTVPEGPSGAPAGDCASAVPDEHGGEHGGRHEEVR